MRHCSYSDHQEWIVWKGMRCVRLVACSSRWETLLEPSVPSNKLLIEFTLVRTSDTKPSRCRTSHPFSSRCRRKTKHFGITKKHYHSARKRLTLRESRTRYLTSPG